MDFIASVFIILTAAFSIVAGEWKEVEVTTEKNIFSENAIVYTKKFENNKEPKSIETLEVFKRKGGSMALFIEVNNHFPKEAKRKFTNLFDLSTLHRREVYGYDGTKIDMIKKVFNLINGMEPLGDVHDDIMNFIDRKFSDEDVCENNFMPHPDMFVNIVTNKANNDHQKKIVRNFLGFAIKKLIEEKKHEEAIGYASLDVDIDKEILFGLGKYYDERGNYEYAIKVYNKVKSGRGKHAGEALERLVTISRVKGIKKRKSQGTLTNYHH